MPTPAFGENVCSPFPLPLEVICLHVTVQVIDVMWVLLIENNFIFCNLQNAVCLVSLMHIFEWMTIGFVVKVVLSF